MSTFDYTSLITTARSLITKFGRNCTLRSRTNSGTGLAPSWSNTDTTITAVVASWPRNESFGTALNDDGTLIGQSDKRFIFYSATEPTIDMQIIDGAKTYSIVQIDEVNPGDSPVVYMARCRR